MNWHNTPVRYGSLSIGLHWLMLLLFIAVYSCIELRELLDKGSEPRDMLKAWHFTLGLLVFILIWLRIAASFSGQTPVIVPAPPAWQKRAAKLMHLTLYALMVVMPILGWLMLSAAGKPIPFFGLELPALIGTDKELSKQIKEVHEWIGTAGYYLIGIHVLAALYHHHIKHDNTLNLMLPHQK